MNITLRQFLKKNDMNVSEGSLHNQKDQQNLLRRLIKGCRKGMQIGFNAGDSADLFLDETGGILTSFDINRHNYVAVGNKYMNLKYPKKHTLIKGDSTIVLPKQKTKKYEYIYIDGGHTFTVADQDIKNCKRFSTPKTIVIIDDYVSKRDWIKGYNKSVIRAVKNNKGFVRTGQKDFGPGRGIIWGHFKKINKSVKRDKKRKKRKTKKKNKFDFW